MAQDDRLTEQNGLTYAWLLCFGIVLATVAWHSRQLGAGELWHYDEFYTYDRVLSFAKMQDWLTVYSLGAPSLKKPPLQYWFSAGLIELGVKDLLALRIPSMLFAACTMLATAALARAMFPRQIWLMPASVLLLATSDQFWWYATSAMLETGAAFFSALGLLSLVLALRDPRYWPTFPVAVLLAGMQKGPTPLAFLLMALVGVLLTQRLHGHSVAGIVKDRRFLVSTVGAVVLGFVWQAFQKIKYAGQNQLRGSVEMEMIDRFIPANVDIFTYGIERFDTLILGGEPVVRLAGLAGLLLIVFVSRRIEHCAMASVALLFVIIMILGSDTVYDRYTLMILPLLCIGAAWLLFQVLRVPVAGVGATLALALVLGGPFRPSEGLAQASEGRYGIPMVDILGPLNAAIMPGDTVVFCSIEPDMLPPGAISLYVPKSGSGSRIYITGTERIERDMRRYKGGGVRGICRPSEIDAIRPYFEDLRTQPVSADFVLWSASAFRATPSQ